VLTKLKSGLTYANVMATIAVFLALGGGAYAALKLPKNSVGPQQIKKGAVSSSKIKDASLLIEDFKAGQVPAGRPGERGPKGDTGGAGAQGVQGERGPSDVYSARIGEFAASYTLPKTVPAGNYLISAKVDTFNPSATVTEQNPSCTLTAAGTTVDLGFGGSLPPSAEGQIAVRGTATIPTGGGTIALTCTGGTKFTFGRGVLDAIQVGTLR
jgi:hypothetical protein